MPAEFKWQWGFKKNHYIQFCGAAVITAGGMGGARISVNDS